MNELQLIEVSEIDNKMEVFLKPNGLDDHLQPLKKLVDEFKGDASTEKGRKEIKSFCYKLAKTKTKIDNVGKELVSDLKKKPKLIDAERKRVRELIDGWSNNCRQPLNEYEEIERKRVSEIEGFLSIISAAIDKINYISDIQVLKNHASTYDGLADFEAQEFNQKKEELLIEFKARIDRRNFEILEDEKKLREQRKDEDRKREIRLENERLEAEQKAKEYKEKLEAAEKEKVLMQKIQAEQKIEYEKQKKEADILQSKIDEQKKKEEEEQKAEAEKKAQENTAENKKLKLIEALDSAKQFIDEENAKIIIRAIALGKIKNVKVVF